MNRHSVISPSLLILLTILLFSCRKDGMNSPMAKKIQYRWELSSRTSRLDYLDGRDASWNTITMPPGSFLEYHDDGYYYSGSTKYQYKVTGETILSLRAGIDRFTTPQYTDTAQIRYVDDHLLVLYKRSYYISGAYAQLNEYIDSLKK